MAKKKRIVESLAEKAVRQKKEAIKTRGQVCFEIVRKKRGKTESTLVSLKVDAGSGKAKSSHFELEVHNYNPDKGHYPNVFLTFDELCKLRDELIRITKRR